jgi:WD40 repeat protein
VENILANRSIYLHNGCVKNIIGYLLVVLSLSSCYYATSVDFTKDPRILRGEWTGTLGEAVQDDSIVEFVTDELLVTSGGAFRVWDTVSGQLKSNRIFRVKDIAFSSEKLWSAAILESGTLKVESLRDGATVHQEDAEEEINFLKFHDGGRYLTAYTGSGTWLWETENWSKRIVPFTLGELVSDTVFISLSKTAVQYVDVSSNLLLKTVELPSVFAVKDFLSYAKLVRLRGQWVVMYERVDGKMIWWNPETLELKEVRLQPPDGNGCKYFSINFSDGLSGNNEVLAINVQASSNSEKECKEEVNEIHAINLFTGELLARFKDEGWNYALNYDGTLIALGTSSDKRLEIYEVATRRLVQKTETLGSPLQWSKSGNFLAIDKEMIRLWDWGNKKVIITNPNLQTREVLFNFTPTYKSIYAYDVSASITDQGSVLTLTGEVTGGNDHQYINPQYAPGCGLLDELRRCPSSFIGTAKQQDSELWRIETSAISKEKPGFAGRLYDGETGFYREFTLLPK